MTFRRDYFRFGLRLLVALGLALALLARIDPSAANACSGGVGLPAERFTPGAPPETSGLGSESIALLGQVQDETLIPDTATPLFLSTVRTVLPLAGEGITSVVRVGPNGNGYPDCSGGPRLFIGEKVMLFLYPSPAWLAGEDDLGRYGDWQSGQTGTPILFDGDDAYYLSWGRYVDEGFGAQERREYVGRSEDVLNLALTFFDATPDQRQQAYAFVLGTAPTGRILPPDTGDGGLAGTGGR